MLPHIILLTKSRTQSVTPLGATWSTGIPSGGDGVYWTAAFGVVSVTDGTNILSGLDWGGSTITGSNGGVPIQLNILWLSSSTGYSWTYATPYPLTAQVQVAEHLSPYFYFIGGGDPASRTVYVTDSSGSSWTAIASTNKGRRQGGLAKIGSTLYAIGGIGTPDGVSNWEYYNGSSWVDGGSVPVACANTSNLAKTIGSNIYILGGGFPNNYSTFYKFNGSTFTALTNTPVTARYSANTVLNGRFYIMGGQQSGSDLPHALVHSTDATGATWQVETSLPYSRVYGSAITYLNQILLIGGEGSGPNTSNARQNTIYRNNQT
jgi:N-acetylneuraminic acid mutarotase